MTTASIIIVNWNTRDFIKECLSSIKGAAGEIPYEVIVVDNASRDDSCSYIEKNYPDVKVARNSVNIGFAGACNFGASLARGEYLLLLNPDTVPERDSIKKIIEFAKNNPKAGAVGPRLVERNGRTQSSARRFPDLRGFLVRDTVLKRILPLKGKDRLRYNLSLESPTNVDQISGAAFLIKRDLWNTLGGMDERFFMFYEEVDLCRRIKKVGQEVVYFPSARIAHLGGGSRHKDKSGVYYYSIKSMFIYFKKYESRWKLCIFKIIYKPLFLLELFLNMKNKAKRDFIKKCLIDFIKI